MAEEKLNLSKKAKSEINKLEADSSSLFSSSSPKPQQASKPSEEYKTEGFGDNEKTKKGDFVDVEYIGRANGEIFDTNIKKEAENIHLEIEIRPLIICIGREMVVKGFDKGLEEKEIGKKYKVAVESADGFGKRNPSLIKIIPMSAFRKQEINPAPGLMLNLDGMIAKILSVSGGRVSVDFNNPLAGKDIEYEFTIKRKITDEKEKVDALQDFFFRKRFDVKIEEKKIIFSKEAAPFLQIMGNKFKELLGKDVEAEKENKIETEKKTEEKKEEAKKEKKE